MKIAITFKDSIITKSMGHHTLKGVVCDRPSILGMFRIENKIGYYRRLKSAVFNSDIRGCIL